MKQSISRRAFLQQSCVLTSASLISTLPVFATMKAAKYKMGLQLYTIRDAMESDLSGTLQKVSAMGYEDLETYGFDAERRGYYGLKASDFKKLISDHNLTTTSGHYDLFLFLNKSDDALRRYVDQCIEGAHILGQRYITWPWLDPESRSFEKFKVLVNKLNLVGEQVTKAGLGFAYHNHDFEFIDHHGETGYDLILRETDPTFVKLQIDLYWVMHTSKDSPATLFRKQPGRFVMWHIKDMDKVTRDYTELGKGSIDYSVILPEAKLAGLQYYYLEQGGNFATSSMQSISDSAVYFRKNLKRKLS